MLVGRLAPGWSSHGLASFLGRPAIVGILIFVGTTPAKGRLTPYVRFNVQQSQYTTDLHWNRISNLEPFGPEAETLLLGHRGPSSV
ncbi:hypothetical protein AVEN_161140-1 [Araneus ventricosus]|uniref:Uncharacterized protein n=1 Tax=Araneus ventricosus TaxID=182803 RepID=A0A4Y2HED5_ARAVE|nr:hypothetical protein AVEN_228975-1 [Araneus ventricosus]GBM63583.1 hypothetical protein AVEN_254608-1 [Araneus ventricosus]GBM63618.1 hypothetical protein AVEN_117693-1 [Araneus ventricosus]GBM63639.1 hypothetical protein AVEN_161140-1 [Araneus ventricosus]